MADDGHVLTPRPKVKLKLRGVGDQRDQSWEKSEKKQFENKIENNMGSTSTGTFDKHEGIDEGESDAAK